MGSATFNSTGGWQHWKVPDKVTLVHVVLHGSGSGSGRRGGKVEGDLSVKPGDALYLLVGGHGHVNSGSSGGNGGFGGGARGGDGNGHPGGDGGGGYSAIRLNSTAGAIKAVAGGGGGDSGDGGDGGNGGADTGESGHRGSAGTGPTGAATGGTQIQGGNGGTTTAGSVYAGNEAPDTALAVGGRGGDPHSHPGPGGGGGGGGYRSGGGGQAGAQGVTPGGGGGGGSNYDGPLTGSTSTQSGGNTSDGSISLFWSDPTGNPRPNTPGSLTPADGKRLKANKVTVKANLTDSPVGSEVRMRIELSIGSKFRNTRLLYSDYVKTGKVAKKDIDLKPNNHYYIRVWGQDRSGQLSLHYASSNFYSNYDPLAPTLVSPGNGHQDDNLGSIVFDWTSHDPDSQTQGGAQLRYVREKDGTVIATRTINGSQSSYTEDPLYFKANTFYQWTVRTKDPLGQWGPWAVPYRLYITGLTSPPTLRSPINGEAADSSTTVRLRWRFRDPNQNDHQAKADVRYRVAGTALWTTRLGTTGTPGSDVHWDFPPATFPAGFRYEWQVRTYDAHSGGLTPSSWSDSEFFHAITTASVDDVVVDTDASIGSLGCGVNEAYLAVKGGRRLLGLLGPASAIQWGRVRDDISNALVTVPIDSPDCAHAAQLLKMARSWQHEVVVFRTANGVRQRVFEGPITRITYAQGSVQVEAKDVMGWVYRRILKQGYDDTYPNEWTVVKRAGQIIMNALAPDDPNVLQYLTMLTFPDDATESRVRHDWSTTAWAEVDDMAQNAGLDYVTVGRRIILWDTSRPIGRLPVMRSADFDQAPVITEYGMLFCTEYGVTDGTGIYGAAERDNSYTGPVELLVSAFGQHAARPGKGTKTAEARNKLTKAYHDQAKRGIASRYPIPLTVRVPDNSTLQPEVPVSIQHLVPGVWIPLQADHVVRSHTGWQKLDQLTVVQDAANGEKVQVIMSPAPNNGDDPDKTAQQEADSGG